MDDLFGAFDAPAASSGGAAAAVGASTSTASKGRPSVAPQIAQYSKAKRASDAAEVASRDAEALAARRAGKRARTDVHTSVADLGTQSDRLTTQISVETVKDCVHEVAVPPGYDYVPMSETRLPDKMAKEYKFVLDPFQKQAVHCIERTESVLVAAHTSAGKTVVAEYAIAMSLRDNQRVIYTSPIKALSNQKYRELQEEFGDVGLMTGDVTINPSASCLVMTTEILRSMMYRGSEVMREVGWVIFDEVHYMRDKERGVVWEETMILLPHRVHFVFLSATIPNALQFARWIAELHNQPCHVVYTEYRPTPLMHYLFPAGGDGLHLVVDERGEFREDSFMRAMAALADKPQGGSGGKGGGKGKGKGGKGNEEIMTIISTMMKRNLNPILVFSFSKRDCEKHALTLSKLDFNDEDEKKLISTVFANAMDALNEDDRKLPQVEQVLPLLKRGIGIHHGGLLPILKEVIEILFGEGLVKVLFATETFAMGLNMPAKTVIFTGVRKFDGTDQRWVTSGEYIQMSGRAGRRGIDDRGLVILMCDEKMEPTVGRGILRGLPDKLNSAYHLTYHTVLNLLVQEEINPETILEKSFFQFQNQQALPEFEVKLTELTAEHAAIEIEDEELVTELFEIEHQIRRLSHELQDVVSQPQYAVPFLNSGRLVKVRDRDVSWGWGTVINFSKKKIRGKSKSKDAAIGGDDQQYIVEVLLKCATGAAARRSVHPIPCPVGEKGEMKVVPMLLALIETWSSARLHMSKDIRDLESRQSIGKSIEEMNRRFKGGAPLLDPIKDMKIPKSETDGILDKIRVLELRQEGHALYGQPSTEAKLTLCARKRDLADEMKALKKQLRKSNSIIKLDELKARKRVLRRLDFASAGDVISLKGRVACCISTGDELVLTELIFNGAFNDLSPEECCALGSCFVFDEKVEDAPKPPKELAVAVQAVHDTARRLCKVYIECKMEVDEDEYVEGFNGALMPVAFSWAKGASFLEVSKMTDVFEGSIIRVMRRLEELLRQLAQAAKAIGNTELELKFAAAISLIKRDIIFHPSLYL